VNADGEARTYGIWWFALAFVVLGAVGLFALLTIGSPKTPTVQLPAASTTEPSTTSSTDPASAPVTMAGGAPAPDGVDSVVTAGDATTFTFSLAAGTSQTPFTAAVPPTTATADAADDALDVIVSCASAGDQLAEITVTESATGVTVLPVVLVPAAAPPCSGQVVRTVRIPLRSPLAGRPVTVVPAGTSVPTPSGG
jgi:hypothetical protein